MTSTIETSRDEIVQCFYNVKTFRHLEGDTLKQFAWEISYDEKKLPEENTSLPIYFILDTFNHEAFSHWVYENSTWLPYFNELRKTYPTIQLAILGWKDYKKLYFQYYGIPLDCVCLQSEIPKENYCFFHTYTSFNDKNEPPIYFYNVEKYKEKIQTISANKTIPILYLPRGKKENLLGCNNRAYNIQDDLKEFIRQLGGTVYETDTTTSLEDQIRIVKSACIIVLDYGSNLWVNGLFAEQSHIVCLNIGWHQHPQYIAMGFLWDKIHKQNTLKQIFAYNSIYDTPDQVATVCIHMPEVKHEIVQSIQRLFSKPSS